MPKIVEGPKAKLMKETIPALRAKAKALNVSDYTKRTKENLVQSIMLAQARKKRGMGGAKPGRPVTKKTVSSKKVADSKYNYDWQYNEVTDNNLPFVRPEDQERFYNTRKTPGKQPSSRDEARFAKQPGKRISKTGKTYYEYRANRADISPSMHGPQDWEFLGQDELGKYEDLIFSTTYKWSILEDAENIEYNETMRAIRIPAKAKFISMGALNGLLKIDAFAGIEPLGKYKVYLYFDSTYILK
jgi:hypothetical protein